ncbi:hypothetical protein BB560_006702, partial [Smittium megazygosporum]
MVPVNKAPFENKNENIKKYNKLSPSQDLISLFGLRDFYDEHALPYLVPLDSSDKKVPEIPKINQKYTANIPGNINYTPNNLIRSLIFSEPRNSFENLPSLSRQTIANAFRFKPGPVQG